MTFLLFLIGLCISFSANAAEKAPLLKFLPEESAITFTVTQNHVPVVGKFSHFTAIIHFSPDNLPLSSVEATIDLASVQTDYEEIATNLLQKEWLDTEHFPNAVFESHNFRHIEGNRYEAVGTLSLHGHNLPVTLPFTLKETETGWIIDGETSLSRTAFTVGTGQWADTSVVEDKVTVKVVAEARKK